MGDVEPADSFKALPDGRVEGQSQSDYWKTQIINEEYYLNRVGDLAGYVPVRTLSYHCNRVFIDQLSSSELENGKPDHHC